MSSLNVFGLFPLSPCGVESGDEGRDLNGWSKCTLSHSLPIKVGSDEGSKKGNKTGMAEQAYQDMKDTAGSVSQQSVRQVYYSRWKRR